RSSASGSHTTTSIAHSIAPADELATNRIRFEFQLLYGMAGPVKRALVEMGYRVREYCPVGELLPGMSYLVRRLLENTSNEGFLRAKFSEKVSEDELLRNPADLISQGPNGARHVEVSGDGASLDTPSGDTYENAPLVNFVYEQNQDRMQEALTHVRTQLGQKYPLVIDGQRVWTDKTIASINPSL